MFLLCSMSVSAQDVIVKKDGSTILSKVLEVGQEEIKYKKFDNLEGPTYSIQKSELQSINYQNGAKDTFSAPVRDDNRYLPNNQNDGDQRLNDNALLELDATSHNNLSAMKTRNTFRWIGGAVLAAFGTACIIGSFLNDDGSYSSETHSWEKDGVAWGGVAFGLACDGAAVWLLSSAVKHQKQIKQMKVQGISLYQHNISFSNGYSLSLGADLLNDRTLGSNTIGLGVRYYF